MNDLVHLYKTARTVFLETKQNEQRAIGNVSSGHILIKSWYHFRHKTDNDAKINGCWCSQTQELFWTSFRTAISMADVIDSG